MWQNMDLQWRRKDDLEKNNHDDDTAGFKRWEQAIRVTELERVRRDWLTFDTQAFLLRVGLILRL